MAGDLESVNYSSARIGSLDDRDFWREMQTHIIADFCEPLYKLWLESAYLSGALDITFNQFNRVQDPIFRGRGWAWVDPSKDMKAYIEGLESNISTLTAIKAEQGIDIEDHFANIKRERELAERYGVDFKRM